MNPLLMMIVISTVFSYFFRFQIENYPIYLLTGQIIFIFYNESTSLAMMSVIDSSSLIKKVYIPCYIFPVSKVLSSFFNLLFSMIAIVLMLFITRTPLTLYILLFPMPLIFILFFSMGIGMIMSVIAVYFRDMTHLYSVLLTALMYLTPIFYPFDILPENIKLIIRLNPLYHIISNFRGVVLYGKMPTIENIMICTILCIVTLTIGVFLFKKKQRNFVLYI